MTMHDCPDGAMRDLLPPHVSGRLGTADQGRVEAHLRNCVDCSAEVELLRAVSRAFPAVAVDAAAIAARIPARRGARGAGTPLPFHGQPLWRIAATLTLFIAGTAAVLVVRGRAPQSSLAVSQPAPSGATTAPETTLASAGAGISATRSSTLLSLGVELSDLSEAELESLLGSLDGLDPRPQADPMTIATPFVPERPQAPGRSNQ